MRCLWERGGHGQPRQVMPILPGSGPRHVPPVRPLEGTKEQRRRLCSRCWALLLCWALAPTLRVVPYRNRHTAPVVPSGGFSSKLAPIPVRPPWLKGRHEAPPSQGRWTRSGRAGDARRATRERGKDQTRRDEGQQRTIFAMPAWPSDLGWRMDVTREEPATDDEGTDGRTEMEEVRPAPAR